QRGGKGPPPAAFITLTTTNEAAFRRNHACLDQISAKLYRYPAAVTGLLEPAAFPTEAILELKRGAQVMMMKNDPEKRWVNGSLGRVSALHEKKVCVEIAAVVPALKEQTAGPDTAIAQEHARQEAGTGSATQ